MADNDESIAAVIGRNVRRLRGGHSMDELVSRGRPLGAGWSSGSIASIEKGNFKPTIEAIALLCCSLNALLYWGKNTDERKQIEGSGWAEIGIRDLLQSDDDFELIPGIYANSDLLIRWLSGDGEQFNAMAQLLFSQGRLWDAVQRHEDPESRFTELMHQATSRAIQPTPGEERIASKIGITPLDLHSYSVELWGQTFENHRDEIAGEGASAQKKGRISRDLIEEIKSAMKDDRGDD